jgi:hypothetical protein
MMMMMMHSKIIWNYEIVVREVEEVGIVEKCWGK